MKLTLNIDKKYVPGFVVGFIILLADVVFFLHSSLFTPMLVIAVTIAWMRLWIDFFTRNQKQRDLEERFVDFVRNLTSAVKSGMPVSRAIMHISTLDYGSLSPHVRKLGYQVEWAIPVHRALLYFGNGTRSDIIKRAIATVIEAEKAGGNMEDVLGSITESLIEIKKIKDQRRANIQSQIMQSYIIFFIFIGVMIVVQNMLVPYLVGDNSGLFSGIGGGAGASNILTTSASRPSLVLSVEIKFTSIRDFVVTFSKWLSSLRGLFIMLSLIQGFFAGITIGKMSEGDITAGLKHSLILMTISFFVMTLTNIPV
ncbi:TPA: type II secretion system F family protein [Candidatus Woesearchaeota archaeon]|nr:Type II secretion system F protein [archaeon GW2011_AR15]MBS3104544.1 type II secretion system F family protein [Candidatus Woesearchaeota archaeon]HIH41142.1 type II secretion system F family protein [Candidatus Woesearchaeota archaeon]